MSSVSSAPNLPEVMDLTLAPPLAREADALGSAPLHADYLAEVRRLGKEESSHGRVDRLMVLLQELSDEDTARLVLAAGKLALRGEHAGTRVLVSALNVKQPGVEVLRHLGTLRSLERVMLRVASGSWREPTGGHGESPLFPILDVLEEATRQGVIDLGIEILPRNPEALRAMTRHLHHWFTWMELQLSARRPLPDEQVTFLVHLSALEIDLLERRISRLAETVDPYDTRGMARLMPVLSRYDQQIAHMKSVISQLTTYRPFNETTLTLETALGSRETGKFLEALRADPAGRGVSVLFSLMRQNPVLDREFAWLTSVVHQVSTLRHHHLGAPRPDVLSTMHQVLTWYRPGSPLLMALEHRAVDALWPTVETWKVLGHFPGGLLLKYREERGAFFLQPDGTPNLPEIPGPLEEESLSLEQLVRSQMHNDAFLLGIFENPQAMAKSSIVPLIATHSRSVRVLGKILRTRALHTGPFKDVPRLLLMNPARVPVAGLRKFINVRFVSRVDLQRMGMRTADVRPEVKSEIQAYLARIKA